MPSVPSRRLSLRSLLLWAAPMASLSCGGSGGTEVVLPSLSISTSTQGVELDPDGYSLIIDGSNTEPVGVVATVVVERLPDGDHVVELSGLASNCSAQGENPRTVSVRSGATNSTTFQVTCAATVGSVEVSTNTSGGGSDPDGYQLLLDGAERGPIASSGTVRLDGIPLGAHSIGLSGLAGNCQVVGDNPRTVTVSTAQGTPVPFSVTCAVPSPTLGTLEISTATTGSTPDPDGYAVALDGAGSQPIGTAATLTLSNLATGSHRLTLQGVASNCSVSGNNPRSVTIAAGQTTRTAFAVDCTTAPPPPPETGTITVSVSTSGVAPDPDGYTVAVDTRPAQSLGVNGSRTVSDLPVGSHTVLLAGLASNCSVDGENPLSATVTAGQTTSVAFAVTCTATQPETGSISVSVSTSGAAPDPDGYTVAVDTRPAQSLGVNGSRTESNLAVGAHTVLLAGLASNCSVEGDNPLSATVTAGQTTSVAFGVACATPAPSVNLRVERMYLTQSVQRLAGDIPLVQGRDGFLRVFVTASGNNNARPAVRVRLYRNGALAQTLTIPAPGSSTPTSVQQDGLGSSWNVSIPGSLIAAGASVLADVDPDNLVAETNEGDNAFPASSSPQALSVQSAPSASIQFVPIMQTANGLQGSVDNPAQLMELARRMYPLNGVSTDIHPVFTVTGPLQPNNGNGQWDQILSDLEALRVADDATDRTYYGMVRLDYGAGIVGNGFVGAPSAIGTDNAADARRVVAHELGHTWDQRHTPCGNPLGIDPDYPYPSGNIGVYGYDAGSLKMPSLPDIMGYCNNPWISDYTYERVMQFRRSGSAVVASAERSQPVRSLLVWGYIADGRAVLEPAFQVVTRPHLPKKPGAYSVEGRAADGSRLFALSFEAVETADGGRNARHFAFAVPLNNDAMTRIESLRLTGPGAAITASAPAAAQLRTGVAADQVEARREAGAVSLRWNHAAYPMLVVRDPDTGEVLSFARGGNALVATTKGAVDLDVSDGVRSQRVRRAISR